MVYTINMYAIFKKQAILIGPVVRTSLISKGIFQSEKAGVQFLYGVTF